MTFNPKKVIVIFGKNKIVDDVDAGIARIRNVVTSMRVHKGKANAPFTTIGSCKDFSSNDRGCSVIIIVGRSLK